MALVSRYCNFCQHWKCCNLLWQYPQNAFIASAAGISLSQFLVSLFPAAVLGLFLNTAFLYIYSFKLVCDGGRCWRDRRDHNQVNRISDTTTSGVISSISQDPYDHEPPTIARSREEFHRSLEPGDSQRPLSWAGLVAFERAALHSSLDFKPLRRRSRNDSSNSAFFDRENMNDYGSFPRPRSLPLPTHAEDQGMAAAAASAGITRQPNMAATANESAPALAEGGQGAEDEGTDEQNAAKRKRACRQRVIFLIWLSVISLISLTLLMVPPQMIANTSTVIEFDLGLVPFGAAILTMLADGIVYRGNAHDVMQKIDWNVILMFIGFFVWLEGFQTTCLPSWAFDALQPFMKIEYASGVALFFVFILITSNILSNVPLTILIVNQLCSLYKGCDEDAPLVVPAMLLAWVTTVAGNFTLIGSIANLIVAEKAKMSDYNFSMTFFGYLKFGVLSTVLVIASGLPTVYFLGRVAEEHISFDS